MANGLGIDYPVHDDATENLVKKCLSLFAAFSHSRVLELSPSLHWAPTHLILDCQSKGFPSEASNPDQWKSKQVLPSPQKQIPRESY